jgi:hypothetical protein
LIEIEFARNIALELVVRDVKLTKGIASHECGCGNSTTRCGKILLANTGVGMSFHPLVLEIRDFIYLMTI